MQFLPNVIGFMDIIANEPNNDDEVLEYAAGLVG